MGERQTRVVYGSSGNGKSFVARGKRLTSPPENLVRALRELGDEESATLLVQTYSTQSSEQRAGTASASR